MTMLPRINSIVTKTQFHLILVASILLVLPFLGVLLDPLQDIFASRLPGHSTTR